MDGWKAGFLVLAALMLLGFLGPLLWFAVIGHDISSAAANINMPPMPPMPPIPYRPSPPMMHTAAANINKPINKPPMPPNPIPPIPPNPYRLPSPMMHTAAARRSAYY